MVKITLEIDGMACGMCESHINEMIRDKFDVKKVTSSYKKGKTEIVAEYSLKEKELIEAIAETGYKVLDVKTEPYEKKGFLKFR